MKDKSLKINWTKVDEAPALASYSFLPIAKAFTKSSGVEIVTSNISLAGRILASFPDYLKEDQRIEDDLARLGELVLQPDANVIKLPNISASVPQLKDAIKELQSKGYAVPDYPEEPKTEEEQKLAERYSKVLGSAVNPVLRQGNSDRRAADSVKKNAQKHPHKLMKPYSSDCRTHVATMQGDDFYGNEKSVVTEKGVPFKIELVEPNGNTIVLKDGLESKDGEVLDGTFMNTKALRTFYAEQIEDAKKQNILFSLHLKATMMKVSDPILFGHAVDVFFKEVFEKYAEELNSIGFNPNFGLGDLYKKLEKLPADKQNEIKEAIQNAFKEKPDVAMVDSDNGITNLHAPNKVIIDASMPVVIRDGGKMWGPDGQLHETKAVIPDRCYSTFYQVVMDDCKANGQFDPATMGSVSNVGLMAQKAEEYGSHPTTFEIPADGTVKVVDGNGKVLMEHNVEKGDVWRLSRVKDIPIKDWVKLAVNRAKSTGYPAIFWLDKNRAHDAQIIKKVETYLKDYDLNGLDIRILSPQDAMRFTLKEVRKGNNVISVSGNVIRDYLTDLFPILELGTSARMLSIIPLLAGGGLFETGAGGSAPKHVQQFLNEGHLRWDSLGEFLALMVSLEFMGDKYQVNRLKVLSKALDKAVETYLENEKSPSRKAGELDNRGSHYYLAQYWAVALAEQDDDKELKAQFTDIAKQLTENEEKILSEIMASEGKPTDIGGYYLPDDALAEKAMRPSATLNAIIDNI
ncbi:NADP-dependent isocitrate dehydrogenase [Candidatus Sulfidibacterium hydrothermale]|uniref:NADP-dependent isocitrate dehydrogenase n=1 Tax=Candidatus Sulfidibacterium hydrothermale TaxID=2875962 RepID=UPI001F0AF3D4|nr:NADP-dependent isocitrate dehydrogenase [Candidatus Sulfidibacterium hydrothermale]UBM63043.1 NADP-dependent isocitrate dehydrogenase [Candidatus Sulfidibacterium hydrothermale]